MTERQTTLAFFLITAVLLIVIAAQARQDGGSTALGHAARWVVSPIANIVLGSSKLVSDTWNGYVNLIETREEHERLAERVNELEQLRARAREAIEENKRLRQLLDLRSGLELESTVAAKVVADLSSGVMRRAVMIDKGRADLVGPGWIAISGGALVGRVISSTRHRSEVMLVVDPDSAVGVRHQLDRYAGVLHGGNRGPSTLEYVPRDRIVAVGDPLVTSGLDGLYPPGLLVGHVQELFDSQITWSIQVRVAVNPSELEHVLLAPPIEPLTPEGSVE